MNDPSMTGRSANQVSAGDQVGATSGPGSPPVVLAPRLCALGVPHGFSTRHGGVSGGVFASLNFGNPGNLQDDRRDPPANIERNFLVLRAAIAPGEHHDAREIVEVHQVHGAAVCVVRRGERFPREVGGHDMKADAIVTDDPARLAAVRVADCAPVLIASADGRVVAAVHAGWRGVIAGVVPASIAEMQRLGAEPRSMAAAVGPCIGAGAFEVGPEVAAEFRRAFGDATSHVREAPAHGKFLIDLKSAIREQLIFAGLRESQIDVLPHCTASEASDFFSHRRDRGLTGRMVGIIGPRAI